MAVCQQLYPTTQAHSQQIYILKKQILGEALPTQRKSAVTQCEELGGAGKKPGDFAVADRGTAVPVGDFFAKQAQISFRHGEFSASGGEADEGRLV